MTRELRRMCCRALWVPLTALVFSLAFADRADAGLIAIEWDRSPDTTVAGYRVSVGTSPGNYTETFDVGSRTFFVYVALDTRPYYFAVRSYSAGGQSGPLSQPVSATARSPISAGLPPGITDARSFYGYLWSNAAPPSGAESRGAIDARRLFTRAATEPSTITCWASSVECLSIRTLAQRPALLTSLAASADGSVFAIEDGQRIGVITSDGLRSHTVQIAGGGTRFGQLVLDPHFADSGLLYVSEIETAADQSRDFRIVRYRVREHQAEDRAAIISLPLPSAAGDAVFATGADGHIYVAVPAAAHGDGRTAYSGMLLRFNADGTVPDEQKGSPLFATGYMHPGAIALDEQPTRLWLAGVDASHQASVSSLDESTFPLTSPVVSLTASDARGQHHLFAASAEGAFGRAQIEADGSLSASQLTTSLGFVRSVAVNAEGDLFVAVDRSSRFGSTTLVVRLTPTQSR